MCECSGMTALEDVMKLSKVAVCMQDCHRRIGSKCSDTSLSHTGHSDDIQQ